MAIMYDIGMCSFSSNFAKTSNYPQEAASMLENLCPESMHTTKVNSMHNA